MRLINGKAKSKTHGQPRPRVVPFWRSRFALAIFLFLAIAAVFTGGYFAAGKGFAASLAAKAGQGLIAASGKLGLTVQEILVSGRGRTEREELLGMISAPRGSPILAFDMEAAKNRIESLPWVQSAAIKRMLPGAIIVRIVERRPLAVWQNKGEFSLIDDGGKVILSKDAGLFQNLLQVVGDDAPLHAAELLKVLATQPELMAMVKTAVRAGGRRWNVVMNNGISIYLPETGAVNAWARLAEYERTHKVLERDVKVLDLRLQDRLIVRAGPKAEEQKKTAGNQI